MTRGAFAEERLLASRAAAADEAALRLLLGRLTPRLRGIAWNISRDRHEAEDFTQEALLKITLPAVLGQYRGDGPLDGYLTNVAVRAMISRRRSQQGWRERAQLVADVPDRAPDSQSIEPGAHSFGADVRAALAELPERAQLVVLMITLGDMSYSEVGATLGLELGTVKSVYSRARATLRERLER